MENPVRRALIVGASSGIGREMALWLAHRGWRVGITGRRKEMLSAVRNVAPDSIVISAFDVRDEHELPGRLDEAARRLGGLDLLVISAGIGFVNTRLDPDLESQTVSTNVDAFTRLADWGYNYFRGNNGGQLAAITSVGGLLGEAAAPAYAASKAYQILYVAALAKRAKKEGCGIFVTELRPGFVDTDMMKGDGHFWVSAPAAAADTACRAILGRKRLCYISRRWRAIGILLRLAAMFS